MFLLVEDGNWNQIGSVAMVRGVYKTEDEAKSALSEKKEEFRKQNQLTLKSYNFGIIDEEYYYYVLNQITEKEFELRIIDDKN